MTPTDAFKELINRSRALTEWAARVASINPKAAEYLSSTAIRIQKAVEVLLDTAPAAWKPPKTHQAFHGPAYAISFAYRDFTMPHIHVKIGAIDDLLRQGVPAEKIREAAELYPNADFWFIVKQLKGEARPPVAYDQQLAELYKKPAAAPKPPDTPLFKEPGT